jgi:hypothetical protein
MMQLLRAATVAWVLLAPPWVMVSAGSLPLDTEVDQGEQPFSFLDFGLWAGQDFPVHFLTEVFGLNSDPDDQNWISQTIDTRGCATELDVFRTRATSCLRDWPRLRQDSPPDTPVQCPGACQDSLAEVYANVERACIGPLTVARRVPRALMRPIKVLCSGEASMRQCLDGTLPLDPKAPVDGLPAGMVAQDHNQQINRWDIEEIRTVLDRMCSPCMNTLSDALDQSTHDLLSWRYEEQDDDEVPLIGPSPTSFARTLLCSRDENEYCLNSVAERMAEVSTDSDGTTRPSSGVLEYFFCDPCFRKFYGQVHDDPLMGFWIHDVREVLLNTHWYKVMDEYDEPTCRQKISEEFLPSLISRWDGSQSQDKRRRQTDGQLIRDATPWYLLQLAGIRHPRDVRTFLESVPGMSSERRIGDPLR